MALADRPGFAAPSPPPSRLFVSSPHEHRPRRASDATLLVAGVLLLIINALVAQRTLRVETAITEIVAALPFWADELFAWAYGITGIYALWLVVAAMARRRPRWDVARDLLVAGTASLVVGLVLARLVEGAWPIVLPELNRAQAVAQFPILRVAFVTAVVAVAGVHLTRPLRRLGWVFVGLVAISGLGLGLGLPADGFAGVGLGIAAAGAVLLVFGSPTAYPDTDRVAADLRELGLSVQGLSPARNQTWGVRTFVGEADGGRPVLVKVYGADARDAQLMARLWRFLWYRDTGAVVGASRLQQVEHEALVTLLAARSGVESPSVLAAALSGEDDAVLALERRGVPVSAIAPGELSDEFLRQVWAQTASLHAARISHGSLDLRHISNDAGTPVLSGFSAGSLSASDPRVSTDVVMLLADMADRVGVERTVDSALQGLGEAALAQAIPYLQVPALTTAQRRTIEKPKQLISSIRARAVEVMGVDEPDPAQLRRVSIRDLAFTSLMVLAAYFLIHQLAGLDLASIWDSMKTAEIGWALAAFLAAQLVLIPNATGMMAAVSAAIPLRPTVVLQSAIQFIGLAVPSSAGRIATNVAYLRKFGVSPVTAVTQGALDSFTGFLVQAAILVTAVLFGDLDFGLGGDFDVDWGLILAIVGGVIVAGVVVVFAISSLRERLLGILGEAIGALSDLLANPRRAVILFSSNFGSQLALAIAMWLTVRAFGTSISLAMSLVIVVSAVLLGGVAPTPGGVGVQEAVLAAGLVSAGIGQDTAFAIAVTYRLFTFFLPPLWGFLSLRWLEKQDYL